MNTNRSPSGVHIGDRLIAPATSGSGCRPAMFDSSAVQSRAPSGPAGSRVSNATSRGQGPTGIDLALVDMDGTKRVVGQLSPSVASPGVSAAGDARTSSGTA